MGKKQKGIPAPQENETPFQRFEQLAQKVVKAPKMPANGHQQKRQ